MSDKTQSESVRDDNKDFVGLAPKALVTITADTAIVDGDGKYYRGLTLSVAATVYYAGTPGTTVTLDAMTNIAVHPNLRLTADTVCFVY